MVYNGIFRNGAGWDPWRELRFLQQNMNRLLGDSSVLAAREYPAINVWSGDNDVVLTTEIPGVEADDLDISVKDRTLTIRCTRKAESLQESETYHRQERGAGSFVRNVQLPFSIDENKIEAGLEKGILRLTLPRAESEKPRKVEVKSA